MNRKKLRCLGGPLDGQFVEDGDAPTIFLEKGTGDESLELVTDHYLPPAMVHYRKIRIHGEGGEHSDYWVADGMTFDDAIARCKKSNRSSKLTTCRPGDYETLLDVFAYDRRPENHNRHHRCEMRVAGEEANSSVP